MMEAINLPRTILHSLNIRRGEVYLAATLGMSFDNGIYSLDELAAELLGPAESAYFSTLRSERRRKSYLLGRYAAKLALKEQLSEPDPKCIEIVKGVFEQPIVHARRNGGWNITISHADGLAVSLAYPTGHPMGIDVERIDQARQETILSQLCSEEIAWVESAATDQQRVATALWTAKEALSKVLTTGLMSPLQIYRLTEFSPIGPNVWEGLFLNFGQYKARVWAGSAYVLSIAMPKRSTFERSGSLCAFL